MELIDKKVERKTEVMVTFTASEFATLIAAIGVTSPREREASRTVVSGNQLQSSGGSRMYDRMYDIYESMIDEGFYEYPRG